MELVNAGRRTLNEEGVAFYSALLDLVEKNIEPRVTLYHWDLPLALEEEYKGWLSPSIVEDFAAYAEKCFELFGHQVKTWTTFNEPLTFVGAATARASWRRVGVRIEQGVLLATPRPSPY